MGKLRDILTACVDHVLAPECAFDSHSAGCIDSGTSATLLGQEELWPRHEWHNHWGAAPDYQAVTDAIEQSVSTPMDTFTSSSSGGFGSGFGGD